MRNPGLWDATLSGLDELTFEDTADHEEIIIHAGRDLNETTEHDRTATVHNDRTDTVDGNHSESVGRDHSLSVTGNRNKNVDGEETNTIGQKRETTVGGLEKNTFNASREVRITGTAIEVAGTWTGSNDIGIWTRGIESDHDVEGRGLDKPEHQGARKGPIIGLVLDVLTASEHVKHRITWDAALDQSPEHVRLPLHPTVFDRFSNEIEVQRCHAAHLHPRRPPAGSAMARLRPDVPAVALAKEGYGGSATSATARSPVY